MNMIGQTRLTVNSISVRRVICVATGFLRINDHGIHSRCSVFQRLVTIAHLPVEKWQCGSSGTEKSTCGARCVQKKMRNIRKGSFSDSGLD
jgi:hypothetical protein